MQNLGTVLVITLIVVLVLVLLGGAGMMGPWMMGGYGGMMGGMMGGWNYNPLGWILALVAWLLIVGGIVWLVVWLVRNMSGTTQPTRTDAAIEILKARYARGEITKEQFNEMKKDLEGS